MRLLVTGGAGFIGSNFVLRTRETRPDWSLTVIDSMTYAANKASLAPVLSDLGGARPVEPVGGPGARPIGTRCAGQGEARDAGTSERHVVGKGQDAGLAAIGGEVLDGCGGS